MLGSFSASVMPAKACGKIIPTSPDFSELISVSLSAFGTMTTLLALGMSSLTQYLSLGTRTSWSGLHDSCFQGRPEKLMLSWSSGEMSSQFWTAAFLMMPPDGEPKRFLYAAYGVLNFTTSVWGSLESTESILSYPAVFNEPGVLSMAW